MHLTKDLRCRRKICLEIRTEYKQYKLRLLYSLKHNTKAERPYCFYKQVKRVETRVVVCVKVVKIALIIHVSLYFHNKIELGKYM